MKPVVKVRVQGAIFGNDNALLLACHERGESRYWVLPGGKVEFGETMEDALKRELREELGFDNADVSDLLFIDEYISPETERHVVLIAFLAEVPDDALAGVHVVAQDESIVAVGFFTEQAIRESSDTFYPSKETLLNLF
ncbi:MAG: NUDIX hydrolase [Brevinematales bacterium]|nr:NUDIX hydrolase [Brevinematales bacterium]